MASAVAEDKSGQRERSTLTDKRHAARDAAGGMPNACDARGAAHEKRAPKRPQIADKPSPSAGFLFFNGVMLKTPMPTQHELEMVTLEELVPK
ncbi:hypothetical protein U0F71_32615, partial [Burkholderia pseudomallei]